MVSAGAIGPYELGAAIHRGRVADVYEGKDRRDGARVAVKVVVAGRARSSLGAEALANELRAAARLAHPAIARVLDYGVVSEPRGPIPVGAPYLVTPLLDGPIDARPPADWPALARVLSVLLSALAHAHARNVIHRDLKASNVLLRGDEPVLVDFGIARALDPDGEDAFGEAGAGTPRAMAPEQIAGDWRSQGPWTDLYALGCLAWELVTGAPLFDAPDAEALRRAHRLEPVGPLAPRFDVPDGLEEWLSHLLAKRPRARYRCAADARWALERLGEGVADPRSADVLPPAEWLDRTEVPAPEPFRASLVGLRPVPLVGRQQARASLLDALTRCREETRPEVVVLRGEAGEGKTHLARWLAERAAEAGQATVLESHWTTPPGPTDGLAAAARLHLRVQGASPAQTRARLRQLGVPHPVALADWLGARGDDPADVASPLRPARPHDAAVELLRWLSRERPVLWIFDDVPDGLEGLTLAERLARATPGPAIAATLVLTASDADLAARPEARARLEALEHEDRVRSLRLRPLAPDALGQLVRQLGFLGDARAAELAAHTGGNPMFATQLVAELRDRGREAPPWPASLDALWAERIRRFLEALPEPIRASSERALAVAAVLGDAVDPAEHAAACAALGARRPRPTAGPSEVTKNARAPRRAGHASSRHETSARSAIDRAERGAGVPIGLVDRLTQAGLAEDTTLGWRFAHPTLRRSVLCDADLAPLHDACAEAIEATSSPSAGRDERVGRHRLGAGRTAQAREALLSAARQRLATSDLHHVHELLDLVAPLDGPADEVDLLRAQAHMIAGRLDEAEASLARVEARGRPGARVELWWCQAVVLYKRGRVEEAAEAFRESLRLATEGGDDARMADGLYALAECDKLAGDLDASERNYRAALALLGGDAAPRRLGRVLGGLADVQRRRGDLERASELVSRALVALERAGDRHGVAVHLNGLGDVQRARGEADRARRSYERSLEIFEALGSTEAAVPRMNLGVLAVGAARGPDAERIFARAEHDLCVAGRLGFALFARAGRLAAACLDADRRRARARWRAFERAAVDHPLRDGDLAWLLETAAERCAQLGWGPLAQAIEAAAEARRPAPGA